jgi:hypothetical protein
LASAYARLPAGSIALDAANSATASVEDILGRPRGDSPDIGAWESGLIFADGFESGDLGAW